MTTDDSDLMASLAALFSEAQAKLVRYACDLCGDNHDLATVLMRAAVTDMEAIARADFINAVYKERARRASQQEGAGNE